MKTPSLPVLVVVALFAHLSLTTVSAQDSVQLSGTIFSDYSYTVTSPNGDMDGENGFGFRRVYLTADYKMSESFSGRVRFEGADNSTTSQGKPAPFVKDLYVKWKNAIGDGHNITFGLSSPPMWGVSEKVWGYRSLEKTIMDRTKIASSRDMGITLQGPLNPDGTIKYALMAANNSGGKAESDKYKRIYGQIELHPNENVSITLGGDYYDFDGGTSLGGNAFAGYSGDGFKLGVEGYLNPRSFDDADEDDTRIGISVFGQKQIDDTKRLVARFDFFDRDNMGVTSNQNWAILGVGFSPENGIEIIPNVIYTKNDFEDDATIIARLTVKASF